MSTSKAIIGICACGSRPLPLRVNLTVAKEIQALLGDAPPALIEGVWLDYRCRDCKQLVPVTVGELLS